MSCVNCTKIRAAILHGKMAEAAGLTVEVLREKFGLTDPADALAATAEPLDAEAARKTPAKAK